MERADLITRLARTLRDVPDFPGRGIVFKDITPVLADAELFVALTEAMADPFRRRGITHVAGIESRGFLLAAPIAQSLAAGVIPIRKAGKLPAATISQQYALEYGTGTLEVHADACPPQSRVLLVDDVLATGGTAQAASTLITRAGGTLIGYSFFIALRFLAGRARLPAGAVEVLLDC